MAVLLKVALLLIYLSVLFLLARLLEAVACYEHGQISRRLLDPMALSVLKLKALLEQRGVGYDGVVEKSELKQLVEASGAVSDDEMEAVTSPVQTDFAVTNFTGDADFYEQVEDAKDSMWLVEIVSDTGMLLSDTSWHAVRSKVGKFGVRFGRLDCQLNVRLCLRRQWLNSRIVLALPENYRTKANVALHTYSGPVRINSLFDWMKQKVNEQIQPIDNLQKFQDDWLNFDSPFTPEVRVVFMSTMTSVPLFLSALSVKFPGRVKVGSIDGKTEKGKQLIKKIHIKTIPAYMILTREGTYTYGSGKGEVLNFRAMEMFLKSFYPSLNDLFIISIVCTNIAGLFQSSLVKGTVWKRFARVSFCVFQYNIVLLLAWIVLLTIFQLPLLDKLCLVGLKLLRTCASTMFFSFIRKDVLYYMGNITLPLIVGLLMNIIVVVIRSCYFMESTEEEEDTDWWNFSSVRRPDYEHWWDMTRLRPFDQIFNPTIGIMSVGGELLDGNQPVISKDYIRRLPAWQYREPDRGVNCISACSQLNHEPEICNKCKAAWSQHQSNAESASHKLGTSNGSEKASGYQDLPCEFSTKSSNDETCKAPSSKSCQCRQYEPPNTLCLAARVADINNPSLSNTTSSRSIDETRSSTTTSTTTMPDPFLEFTKAYALDSLNMCKNKPDGYIEGTQCVICLDNYTPRVLLCGLPCGHVYHARCIGTWLMRENHFCPVCRWASYKPKEGGLGNRLHME